MDDRVPELLPRNPWPLAAVGLVFGVGVLLVLLGLWRTGVVAMAVALLLAAALRATLPRRLAGLLVLRRRLLDVAILGTLGASILVFALLVPAGSY